MRAMIKMLKNNIYILAIRERLVLSLILICSFLTGIILPFSYGLYYNYSEKLNAQFYETKLLQIGFVDGGEGGRINKEILKHFLDELPVEVTDCIDMFFVRCTDNLGRNIECRFSIIDSKYMPCMIFRDNLIQEEILNGYFSDEEENLGEKVAIVEKGSVDSGGIIWLFGEEYKVKTTHEWGENLIMVPFLSLSEEVQFDNYGLVMGFKKAISSENYEIVKKIANDVMGNLIEFPEMPQLDYYQLKLYKSIILLSVLMGISISINYIIIYQYLFNKRKYEMGVFWICGMKKSSIVITLVLESIVLLIPGSILGMICFHYLVVPIMYKYMIYAVGGYDWEIYVLIMSSFSITFEIFFGIFQKMMIKKKDINYMIGDQ